MDIPKQATRHLRLVTCSTLGESSEEGRRVVSRMFALNRPTLVYMGQFPCSTSVRLLSFPPQDENSSLDQACDQRSQVSKGPSSIHHFVGFFPRLEEIGVFEIECSSQRESGAGSR